MADVSIVEFLRSSAPYQAGERASFDPIHAKRLVAKGVVKMVKEEVAAVDPKTAAEHQANADAAARTHGDNSRRPAASQRGG